MASQAKRQLAPTAIPASYRQPDQQVTDFGAYRVLEVYIKILKTGPAAGTVYLAHNASLDPDNWKSLAGAGASIAQNGTDVFVTVSDFLRYIRIEGNASGDGTCIALADVVAKE